MKKIISIFLCVVLLLAVLPSGVVSADALTSGFYTYTVSNGEATITECKISISGSITIPSTLGGYPVTTIGRLAFRDCFHLTSVTIPDSVTTIGYNAFQYCSSLTSVTIGNSVTTIGSETFRDCTSLTSVTIPDSVTSIGHDAFYNCTSLTSITLPNSLTTIGSCAFLDCTSLTSITIPDSVTTIGDRAFYRCTSLTSVTIPNSVTTIGYCAFYYCTSLTSVTIPNSVTTIDYCTFNNCTSLKYVYYTGSQEDKNKITIDSTNSDLTNKSWIYNSFHVIGSTYIYAVSNGNATIIGLNENLSGAVTIPSTLGGYPVTAIGDRVFENTDNIVSVIIPNSVTVIGGYAFNDCDALASVTIPDSVTTIGDYAFYKCTSLTSITLPNSVTTIGYRAFYNCTSLTSVTIGNSLTTIGEDAFYYCTSLTSITVSKNNNNYSSQLGVLFNKDKTTLICYPAGKTVTSYIIPNSVKTIGDSAFYNCTSLTSVTIPNSVTSIGVQAFKYCESLTSVTIPDSVTTIGDGAFSNCFSLADVYYNGTKEEWKNISIGFYNSYLTDANLHFNCVHKSGNNLIFDNTSTYPFDFNNGIYSSTNKTDNSSSSFIITALADTTLELSCYVLSESIYDKLIILQNNSPKVSASGTNKSWTNITLNLSKDDIVEIKYIKDGSTSSGDDTAYFKIISGVIESNCISGFYCIYCGVELEPARSEHSYTNSCDATCDVCGLKRENNHIFINECDTTCDICGFTREINHTYVNECDTTCDICGFTREINHTYVNECDTTCDICGFTREINHTYVNDCDTTCEICGFTRTISHTYENNWDAECNVCGEVRYYTYIIENGEVVITGCDTSVTGDITLPSALKGYPVVKIDEGAFYSCSLINSIIIPNSVIEIGDYAFCECTSLTNVIIPESVTTIGFSAFGYCSSLATVTIGNGETTIADYAFFGCESLTDVYFKGTKSNAQKISIGYENDYLTNATWHYEKEKISEEYLTYKVTNGEATITGCNQSVSGDVAIPSTLGGYPVTAIADYAFYGCNLLTNIELPKGITTIGSGAFNSCSALVSVIIPESVTSIGLGAFSWCNSLESIEVSENSDYFVSEDGILFNKDKTTIICYPASKTETTYTVPESVTTIGSRAFLGCTYLVSITIPNSVTSIGNDAFYSCSSLKDVYYNGCKAKVDKIPKGSGNTALTNAVWHYEPNTDFDGDNVTDKKDYQYIADVYTGKIKVQKKAEIYDMNGDGEFDIRDIVAIKEIINA